MWQERLLTLLQGNRLPLVFASIGLLLIAIGVGLMVFTENKEQGVIIEEAASTERDSPDGTIIVDVSGAVLKPGVYKLSLDSRVQEALVAAGGLAESADRSYVSKNINLAAKISDGAKIYVPRVGEVTSPLRQGTAVQAGTVAGSVTGLISINTAGLSELDTLPGIGPKTAQKIIDGRPYGSLEDLLNKKIVGNKVFEDIKEKITAY